MITESASSGNVHSSARATAARRIGSSEMAQLVARWMPSSGRELGQRHRDVAAEQGCGFVAADLLAIDRRLVEIRDRPYRRRAHRRCRRAQAGGVAGGGRVRDRRARQDEHRQPGQQPAQRDSAHFCHGGHDLLDVKTARTGRNIPVSRELRYNCAMRGAFLIALLLGSATGPCRQRAVRRSVQCRALGRRYAR